MRRSLVLSVLIGALLAIPAVVYAAHRFSDVPSDHTFHEAIDWMADNGITVGCNPPANTNYCPEDPVTRGQMAAFLRRLATSQAVDAGTVDGQTVADIVAVAGGGGATPDLSGILTRLDALEADVTTLEAENTTLQTQVAALEAENAAQQVEVSALQTANSELQTRFSGVTRNGTTLLFEGMNLQVVNGVAQTASTNGLGNLIIGYNEDPGMVNRTGSHNVVIGVNHTYSSFGGLVVGSTNAIMGEFATVTGGGGHIAAGNFSSVSGGQVNVASGLASSVLGGTNNTASAVNQCVPDCP